MIITWYGHACFKIQTGDFVIVTDPFAKEIGLAPPRVRADMALVSHSHADHANVETLAGHPFLIKSPGEYEVRGVSVQGIETFHDAEAGALRGVNTAYVIQSEELTVAHLGDFGEDELRPEIADAFGRTSRGIDVLMIPVGGVYTIDAKHAAKIVKQIEPAFVIPMHYQIPGLNFSLDGVEAFLKEMGAGAIDPIEKFSVRKKDITDEKKTEVVLLKTT